jgi:CRISPR-associated protein Csb2
LRADDLHWAFSGLEAAVDPAAGEVLSVLMPTQDNGMLAHFGSGDNEQNGFRLWRSVTPIALPLIRPAGRVGGRERAASEAEAASSVCQALRHAGVVARVETIRVQREPFERRGEGAEAFAVLPRFSARRLYHAEIAFAHAVSGPLILGDGRYLGLGLMAPVKDAWRDVLMFSLRSEPPVAVSSKAALLQAVRRALMSLSRNDSGAVPRLFSGHEVDGAPASSGRHEHVFLASIDADNDGYLNRLIVAAPWACDRSARARQEDRALFDRIVSSLAKVKAGRLGVIIFDSPVTPAIDDSLTRPARVWESRTLYRPTRHLRRSRDPTAIADDVITECQRRRLPQPHVEVLELSSDPNRSKIEARLRLLFSVSVNGPIMLGHNSHMGGGLFRAELR